VHCVAECTVMLSCGDNFQHYDNGVILCQLSFAHYFISFIYTPYLKKPDTPIMSHNSSKNPTVSMIFDKSNCPSTLDTLP